MKIKLLSLALALCFAPQIHAEQNSANTGKANSAEIEKARKDMERAIERYADLARKNSTDGMHSFHYSLRDGDGPISMMGTPRTGLGIVMSPNTAAKGVIISEVNDESPAQKAGLKDGDVIISINGKSLSKNGEEAVTEARGYIGQLNKGDVVNIGYLRAGKQSNARVTAGPINPVRIMRFSNQGGKNIELRPNGKDGQHNSFVFIAPQIEGELQQMMPKMMDEQFIQSIERAQTSALQEAFRWNSLHLSSVDAKLGRYFGTESGVLVITADEQMQGIEAGDVIVSAEGKNVNNPRNLMRILREKGAGEQLNLEIFRDKQKRNVKVKVPDIKPLPFAPPPPPPPGAPKPPKPPKPAAAPKITMLGADNASYSYAWSSDDGQNQIQVIEVNRDTSSKNR
jgi:predicted metalloprotease with PDZ domain